MTWDSAVSYSMSERKLEPKGWSTKSKHHFLYVDHREE